ncbi:MAG TPA: phosphate ABC transporter substrate-binding protein, partial [Sandaracinaceae bacterium LLY-WYZ-13_1]|nr:phosphate ABC transporter substrate-binding protein [Sandaracinaceae bacterium LLY-WYZ-13_1]
MSLRSALWRCRLLVLAVSTAALAACSGSFGDARQRLSIRGSDTMVILAQRWAEAYMATHPETTVQVTGGGSGTGLAALINGTTDIANASRPIHDRERRYLRRNRGAEAHETPVALDAVAVYVHGDNPIESLTIEQLAGVFRGQIEDWSELGEEPGPIVLYSRENNSGTYAYFKEHVLDGLDFDASAQTLPGTAAVINA